MENIELTRLKKEDFGDVVNLLNTVFSAQNGVEMDFESSFPRIFIPDDKTMGWHIGAKINGRLCGVAASYPLTYRVGGTDLKISAGGNVAVDAKMRGRGIMQSLLNKLDEEDRADGFDLSYLHGDRFRYRNFGYERCGTELYFTFTRQMLGKDAPKRQLEYVDFRTADEGFSGEVFEFYNSQSSFLIRDFASFLPALKSKKRLPLAVKSEDGELIAYLAVGDDGCISEIFVKDEALFPDVIKGYMERFDVKRMYLGIPPYNPLLEQARRISDRYIIMQPGNSKIFNFKRVAESFMREKESYEALPDGNVTIDSAALGKWSIEKCGNEVNVEKYAGKARHVLPGLTVYPFVFGTLPPSDVADDPIVKSWFPLPLYCPYLT